MLGSRSPRRLELLQQIVPAEAIEVLPPSSSVEAGFEGLADWPAVEGRLLEIARGKCADVLDQLSARRADPRRIVITADTIVVVRGNGGRLVVLGQPPEDASWPEVVRRWFLDYYAGQTHEVATAFCVAQAGMPPVERIVRSAVTFHDDVTRQLDWYLATGDPRGKAGGYAVQGAGGIFISRIDGSLSNVVGLPLRELVEVLSTSK